MSGILKRFPDRAQILPVYAVIAFVVYAWALLWFFWKLPGWLYVLNIDDILSALTYVLAINLVESLVVLCGPLALSLILPLPWFRDVFVARGTSLSIGLLGYLMFLADRFKNKIAYPALPLAAWTVPVALIAIASVAYVGGRIAPVRKVTEAIADRLTIFVYLFAPASILSLVAIFVRTLVR